MNAQQYRTHPNRSLSKAFLSGELVGLAGREIANPYRRPTSKRSPRRGSWSESYARAWALGKEEGERERAHIVARDHRQAAEAAEESTDDGD